MENEQECNIQPEPDEFSHLFPCFQPYTAPFCTRMNNITLLGMSRSCAPIVLI